MDNTVIKESVGYVSAWTRTAMRDAVKSSDKSISISINNSHTHAGIPWDNGTAVTCHHVGVQDATPRRKVSYRR